MTSNLNELYDAILVGKLKDVVKITKVAVEEGMTPHEVVNRYMIKVMEEIEDRLEAGKVFVPSPLMSARAIRGALDVLKSLTQGQVDSYVGEIMIDVIKGDLYDTGKNLVAFMFEGCGFEVINLGVDVSSDKSISAALENKADIICMSALLTTTVNYMKEAVAVVEASELKGKVKIMAGGAPVNDAFVEAIGADTYTSNANAAVVMAEKPVAAS